jgi:isoquinoline 1-oxidoreductase subunit beta
MTTIINASRRDFLQGGVGLALGVYLAPALADAPSSAPRAGSPILEPNAFIRVGTDNTVTVVVKHVEMGQGTYTGLPTLAAEELDADLTQIRVVGAPADAKRYNNLLWGPAQGTGGSTAVANSYEQMRKAGATARAMLVQAAAGRWQVPAESITVHAGVVQHAASHRQATFGELAAAAAALPVPERVTLKDPKNFVYIGRHFPRTDSFAKTNGSAVYTQDVHLDGMLVAVVAHPPRFGGRARSVDASATRKIRDVVDVVEIPQGVAVLATNTWAARRGRDALNIEWDDTNAFKLGSAELLARYRDLAKTSGTVATKSGNPDQAFAGAKRTLEAAFEFPYLAHSAMEPMNCVVNLGTDRCEVWNGEQFQTADQAMIAQTVGLKPEQVSITMLYAGGSFGRRANPHSDYPVEAAAIAKALRDKGRGGPVKLVWQREDDTRAGYYRPYNYHTLRAALDERGKLVAWHHRIVGQSILKGTAFESSMVKNGIDATSVEGAANLPYAVPNLLVDLHSPVLPVPVQWWRSVGSTHTAFSTEVFLDEVAHASGRDPYALRRELLADEPRHLRVLELAARKAGWGTPLAPGPAGTRRGRGLAVHESFNTAVAEIAEVTVHSDGSLHVDRVVCAVDCGVAVNPDVIRAQMEGGIGYGLSAALHGEITFKDGQVEQSNFNDYVPLRINEMPAIEVHIVPSTKNPTGVGEPGTPVVAPAVANAVFAATGERLRKLPLRPSPTSA